MPVYASYEVGTAATDGFAIYVNPEYFGRLSDRQKMYVLVHEALHVVFDHTGRSRVYIEKYGPNVRFLLNVVADAIVNRVIEEDLPRVFESARGIAVTWAWFVEFFREVTGKIPPDPIEAGFERLVDELLKHLRGGCPDGLPKVPVDVGVKPGDAREVYPGDRELAEKAGELDTGEYARRVLARASVESRVVKMAGNVPGCLERYVARLLKPQLDWRRLLKQAFEQGLGRDVRRVWSRFSRKGGDLPYKVLQGLGRVFVLVDVSGSIDDREFTMFLTEIYGLLRQYRPCEVWAYFWDVGTRQRVRLARASDVKRVKAHGGGGTVILPTLMEVVERLRADDALVIMSDFYLYDTATDVAKVLSAVRRKTRRIVLVATPDHNRGVLELLSRYASATVVLPRVRG